MKLPVSKSVIHFNWCKFVVHQQCRAEVDLYFVEHTKITFPVLPTQFVNRCAYILHINFKQIWASFKIMCPSKAAVKIADSSQGRKPTDV